ncbi:phosphate signaling complex protein PhoU [Corynebacterium pygosceleis]|uniref:Phosphate-specific transport system accessory protein PhoU n=1 Tax=Corynebacterium pygosceleis TaxID=2800406 RepID=A0A9Q4GKG3_9CORY|nr:phosphate signaling complex protein PhoU [Corynebacterium pygosceleis]MCK7638495.1 phosphate signaling complex protein PhoU [Corynebacterium pygosceleis]MCK7675475.1 phosphate signaling complex protein PhoU [Corynebacterium pygosceleis]MCX7445345.1 phosphate signaling complex protein PhoU [Corynebacterium pygosceleis]MCX7469159.1 phosphate signaling complex protein PhoU [Corynebacterium pygosceleis]
MRTSYREHLDAFAHDLIIMCDQVHSVMSNASDALLRQDLQSAEKALSLVDELEIVRLRCEERAVQLLALEGPLARDLRQVISSIYIVEDMYRMGVLAKHVARTARRRHPEPAVPGPLTGYFEEMSRVTLEMSAKVREILIDPDVDVALVFGADDDAVDDLHEHLFTVLTKRAWPYSTTSAVDVTLLSRYYERYADHAVNVASRIVYLTTGLMPRDYMAKRREDEEEADIERRFEELERRFSRGGH